MVCYHTLDVVQADERRRATRSLVCVITIAACARAVYRGQSWIRDTRKHFDEFSTFCRGYSSMPYSISPLLHPRTKSGCKWMSTKAVPISFSGSRCSRVSSMHLVASSAAKLRMAWLKWRDGNCPCSSVVGMGSRIEVLFQKFRPLASSCRTMISVTSRRYT